MFRTRFSYFFILLSFFYSLSAYAAIPVTERNALIALYHSAGGDSWTNNTGWLGAAGTECNWKGVHCAGDDVVGIILHGNGLVGTIPRELGQLTQLHILALTGGQLSGAIPVELGQLSQLRVLSLFDNQLSGTIPFELGQLSLLEDLDLIINQLTGPIPPALGLLSRLKRLWLVDNQLSGTIPIELSQLSLLEDLNLTINQLTGPIPPALGLLSRLKVLALGGNQLSGTIPIELSQLSLLESLSLGNNQLSGTIPFELSQLSLLESLILSRNQLTGGIPPELGQLSQLEKLYLYENQLSGDVPSELTLLSKLSAFIINHNCLNINTIDLSGLGQIANLDIGSQEECASMISRKNMPIVLTVQQNKVDIPLVYYDGMYYKLTLDLYNNSLDQQGWYFRLGDVALVTDAGIELQNPPVVEIDPQSLEITFNEIIFRELTFSGTFYPYSNPNDVNGIYFQMFPGEFIPNGTIINP